MLKKMLGKKRSSSASSSDEESETKEERKQKKSSMSNLKTILNGSPQEKKSSVTTTKVRSRRSSSSDGSSRRGSLPHVSNSMSNISLTTVDLTGSPIRSRSSSLQSSESSQPFSAGEISLEVHSARKLEKKGMFGKADPYVYITFGAKKLRSKTVNNNQNPEWNFDSVLAVDNPSLAGHVLIEIFDDDVGKDDLLGVVAIPTSDVLRGKKVTRKWYALDQCKSGEICVSMGFRTQPLTNTKREEAEEIIDEIIQTELVKKSDKENDIIASAFIPGEVSLDIHEARKLEKKGLFGKADPYVVITLGQTKAKTKTINNNLNPVWNHSTRLYLIKTERLVLEVFDDDIGKDDPLGTVSLDLQEVLSGVKVSRRWFPLEKCKSGEICVSLTFEPKSPSNNQRSRSSSSSSSSSESEDEETDIKKLNNKLITYIDRVRMIQSIRTDIPVQVDKEEEIQRLKREYENELSVWRHKFTQSEVERENNQNLERALREEMDQINSRLETCLQELRKERNELSEYQTKMTVRERELLFNIDNLERQLEFEKKRCQVDISMVDVAMKSEFEKR